MYRLLNLSLLCLFMSSLYGQVPGAGTAPATQLAPAPAKPIEQDPFGRDTPRGCVLGFLKAAERGDYGQAAQYLDVRASPAQAQDLARQLDVVLNHGLTGTLDGLSRTAEGNLKDSLRNNRDSAGFVETTSGKLEILLDRVERTSGSPIWLFSSETLQGVPRTFSEINAPGIERFIPHALREVKVLSLPLWRWLAIAVSMGLALLAASLLTRLLILLLRIPVHRMTGQEDDRYLLSLRRPMRLTLLALTVRLLANYAVSLLGREFWIDLSQVLAISGFSWLLIELSDIVSNLRSRQLLQHQTTNQIAVLALAHRLFKILVVFAALVLLLHGAGVNVSAMLAGLGIGGIALALAAQKTLEDLFGGIAIITREAVRVGDFCKLADQTGTIEDIGLGSTRVRTLDDTVVTIPNAKVSQMNLENYSLRRKIWFHHVFGLRYETSPEQLRSVLHGVTGMLRGDPRVETESARIRLVGFGVSSLNFEIFAYVRERDYGAFLEIQEDLLLKVMDVVAASGTRIALPSQLTYLDRSKPDETRTVQSGSGGQVSADEAQPLP